MTSLATWLEAHKEALITASLHELATQDTLRKEAEGPVRWFFDRLIETIAEGEQERLEALLRSWVAMAHIPINGYVVGLLPVLGVFKRAIWKQYQAAPPLDKALALAIELDGVITRAVEFLSRLEAATLLDAASHQLIVRQTTENHTDKITRDFVSVAAHELKTPLTVIEGYAKMLGAQLSEEAQPREALMVRGIESGVLRLRQIVEDMVDVSMLEASLLTLDFQPVWLQRLVASAIEETQRMLGTRKITFVVKEHTFPEGSTIGDPEHLLKAFQKVLANAVKYTPDGGTITIFSQERKGYIEIVIQDSGIGIAPENLERIFEKFVTFGDASRHSSGKVKFKGGGPGLGLVIARGIVEAHNGAIWAESIGHDETTCPGTHFHIMLPGKEVALALGMLPFMASELSALDGHMSKDVSALIAALSGTAKRHLAGSRSQIPNKRNAANVEEAGESQAQTPAEKTSAATAGASISKPKLRDGAE